MCQQLVFGIVFGVLGTLLSAVHCAVQIARAFCISGNVPTVMTKLVWNTRVDRISCALAALSFVVFAVNAGFLTSPMSLPGGIVSGEQPCNIYFASWVCFALSLYLAMRHVEMWLSSLGSNGKWPRQSIHQWLRRWQEKMFTCSPKNSTNE